MLRQILFALGRCGPCRRLFLLGSVAGLLSSQTGLAGSALAADLNIAKSGLSIPRSTIRLVPSNVRVFTGRNATGASAVESQFGSERGGTHFGKAEVVMTFERGASVPISSEIKQFHRFEERAFLDLSRNKSPDRKARLYVPGYNNSFEDAILDAARLKYVVGADAPMYVYSWPSLAGFVGFLGYSHDVGEIDFSVPLLRRTILNLLRSPDIDRLQILGHSLGCRAIVAALNSIYESADRALLKGISEVVLAAPDVDQDVMDRDFLPVADYAGFDTTVYVSNKDTAMWWSEKVNGQPRVGSTDKRIYVRKQITTIEVGSIDQSRWGHSLFNSHRIAADLYYGLNQRIPAKDRHGLRRKSIYSGSYWCMEP